MALSNTNIIALTDKLAAYYIASLGTLASGYGAGNANATLANDWGMSRKARDFQTLVLATADASTVSRLLSPSTDLVNRSPVAAIMSGLLYTPLTALGRLCAEAGLSGVNDVNSFASYYNVSVGGPYAALLHPSFNDLYYLVYNTYLSAQNVFSPEIATMATQVVGTGFTAGTGVDTAKYAGVGKARATITGGTFGGSGTLTVTGTARTSAGALVTGRTFTATVGANGTFDLTPTVAGDLLCSVASVTVPGTMSAGTVVVGGVVPTGRTAVPT